MEDFASPLAVPSDQDWLSLQEACDLLGVTGSTIRRWADSGKITARRTIGGHRRFARAALLDVSRQDQQATGSDADKTDGQLDVARQEWHHRFASLVETAQMRELGQRLLGLFVQYLDGLQDEHRYLAEARTIGGQYGAEASRVGISLHDTVAAFLFFRRFSMRMARPALSGKADTDVHMADRQHERVDIFMDTILLGAVAGYEASLHQSSEE